LKTQFFTSQFLASFHSNAQLRSSYGNFSPQSVLAVLTIKYLAYRYQQCGLACHLAEILNHQCRGVFNELWNQLHHHIT